MELEERFLSLARTVGALNAKMEISDALMASIIATHPDPGAVRRAWQPIVAAGSTGEALSQVSGSTPENQFLLSAVADHIQRWTDVLQGLEQNARERDD